MLLVTMTTSNVLKVNVIPNLFPLYFYLFYTGRGCLYQNILHLFQIGPTIGRKFESEELSRSFKKGKVLLLSRVYLIER